MTKGQKNKQHANHLQAFKAALMLLLLVICVTNAAAQDQTQTAPSTDRDNPTPLTANVITGDGVDDKTEYFYSFPAGPGEVSVTLDVKAEKGTAVSSVDIALFDAKSNKLLSTYANPDHGSSKRAVESAKVRGTQTLLLEVTVSQGVDSFKIKLGGAIKIAPSTDAGAASAPDSSAPPADTPAQPSSPPDDETLLPDTPPATTETGKPSARQTSAKPLSTKKVAAAVAGSKSGEAQAVTSATRLNAPTAQSTGWQQVEFKRGESSYVWFFDDCEVKTVQL